VVNVLLLCRNFIGVTADGVSHQFFMELECFSFLLLLLVLRFLVNNKSMVRLLIFFLLN